MSRASTICALAAVLTTAFASAASPASAQSPGTTTVSTPAAIPGETPAEKRSARLVKPQQKAVQLMESVEADMGSFPPELQVELLLEIAEANQNLDRNRQVASLLKAFDITAVISDASLRRNQQYQIVSQLSRVDPDAVASLRNVVDPRARGIIDRQVFRQNMRVGRLDAAVDQLSQWDPAMRFPYFEAVNLIARLGAERPAQRQAVFSAAVSAFRHEDDAGFYGFDSLDRVILNCYNNVPAHMVAEAIAVFLARAKPNEDAAAVTLSGNRGSAVFQSIYGADLFRLLPILQKVDPTQAQALIRENPEVASQLRQYPDGITSLGIRTDGPPNPRHVEDNVARTITLKTDPSTPPVDLRIAEQEEISDAIVEAAATDPKAALDAARKLINQSASIPSHVTTPRCDAILGIADKLRSNGKFAGAREALRDLVAAVGELPPLIRANYLVHGAAISAQIDDPESARQSIALTMKAAADLYRSDAFGSPANSAPKILWPSTAVWKSACTVAAQIDPDFGITQAGAILDPEIAATVKMTVAAALIGQRPLGAGIEVRHGDSRYQLSIDIPWWNVPPGSNDGYGAAPPYRVAQ